MEDIIRILHEGNYSCVVKKNDKIHTFSQRGVADLYDMLKSKPYFLKDACIADKVVGKAAAALMILGGISRLYTDTISSSALLLLHESDIKVDYTHVVPFIQNRDKTGWCPLEKLSYEITSAETIFPLIEEFISKIRKPEL
ncbi:DUF1893 domain-containing protein [Dysgonomonas sp. 216]|uniref:DUF1893 domain-containing protein n=1 Tax=Dysgonomonas sp. 216 TaxID=2302934 RepID=UPI0013D12EAF|nr:DUF1893 domain-containing protein [Dysgonomonas sp. 216]NDW18826.1 DUF1893 domain-containing protein [Dysgonomonas sp. 216]